MVERERMQTEGNKEITVREYSLGKRSKASLLSLTCVFPLLPTFPSSRYGQVYTELAGSSSWPSLDRARRLAK